MALGDKCPSDNHSTTLIIVSVITNFTITVISSNTTGIGININRNIRIITSMIINIIISMIISIKSLSSLRKGRKLPPSIFLKIFSVLGDYNTKVVYVKIMVAQ